MESKTPICDQWKYETDQGAEVVDIKIAMQIESQLARANELLLITNQTHIENQQLRKDLDGERETNQRLTDELAEARAEIERKNALIEQRTKSLKEIVAIGLEVGEARYQDAIRCFNIAEAALSAAERGER